MCRLLVMLQLVIAMLWAFAGTSAVQAQTSSPQTAEAIYLPIASRERALLNDVVRTIEPAAVGSTTTFHTPMDATPDPDGNQIYFTAMSSQGAALFRVAATGGDVVTLTVGTPLVAPVGLVVSTDGQRLYLADPSAVVASTQKDVAKTPLTNTGALFTLPSSGGSPTIIAGTEETAPRGLTLINENNVDMIYFTGVAPADGQPAVMKIPASGGPLTVVEKGGQLVAPVGIAVSKTGALYIADQAASGGELGAVFRINPHTHGGRSSHAELLADRVRMGNPAGITLTFDESLLLVSTLETNARTSQVLVINTTTRDQGIVNKIVGVNTASGGLHRAHNNNRLVWCGVTAGTSGQGIVYRISF